MSKPRSTNERPLALRWRPDLVAVPVEMSGVTTWIVKDPLTLEHFQLTAEEYAVATLLRRRVSIAEVRREFARLFPPQSITPEDVWNFLGRLHANGLLVGDAAGQGRELLAREGREQLQRRLLAWTQLLAIRLRGVNPDRFLTWLNEKIGWLLSPPALMAAAALVGFALSLVLTNWDSFYHRLPELSALVDLRNLPWLLLAIGLVKVLHELGHALVCKRFGGEVHEMGLMFLAFAPCLYCDVSDAWRLRSKWQRIAVSAAGMGVELVVAAVATIAWWYAQPGLVQLVALNIVLVATVNTLLVNGNPLLRYDGYYVLSDLVESPNLWQRSRDALAAVVGPWFVSRPGPQDPLVPARQRAWLAAYAIASKAYLAFVCVAIVWGLAQVLRPLRLETLAYAVGLVVVGSAVVRPAMTASELLRNPLRRSELRKGRVAWTAALGLAATVAILSLPVNYYVPAPLTLMPNDAARVFATVDGTLTDALQPGARVKQGAAIARLESADVELELARLEGEFRLRQLQVEHLERLRAVDPEANNRLPAARAARDDSDHRLANIRREAERLVLKAPTDGVVMAGPRTSTAPPADAGGRLPGWTGSLLEESQRGALVEAGTLVCLVGDPRRIEAVLLVTDADVKRLRPGQIVRMCIDQLPGQVIEGQVVEVARHDAGRADSRSLQQADLAALWEGMIPPGGTGPLYQVRVRFPTPPQQLILGGRGEAKVAAERITLGRRLYRYFAQTFRLPM